MKWLVIWWVISQVQTSCPDFKSDPYSGGYPTVSCAVYHAKNVVAVKHKLFKTQREAQEFKRAAPFDLYRQMQLVELPQEVSD